MNMLKRSLAMLLVLTMLFSFVPFSVFADDGESAETTAVTEAVEQRSGGPGNSDFGHSQGNGKDKHKDPLKETEAPEVTEAPTETTVPETTVPETTVPETTVPETTVPETTVPETTVPETTVPETTVPEAADLMENPYGIMTLELEESESVAYDLSYASAYRILHLDCGRKYFTKDWIIALINEMSAAGYTHLELAFGNDGLRFLLDDMSVGTYTDEQVTAAIQAGNKQYHDFATNELTQTEMNAIISHANSKDIKIIPLLNNPGHMNAIVYAAATLTGRSAGYNGSASTVDLENTEAVAFVKGLVEKYVAYFDNMGCNEFNFGADEYANDVYSGGSMGFGALTSAGKYQLFVDYVNEMADMIKGYGMVPIAFNDGIYFNQNTSYNFDKQIMVAFWTSGWSGYQSASASTMADLGHKMINVNGDYYYVLGKNDQWDSNSYTYASNWSNSAFMGSNVSNPMGGMFCIWCDYPDAETEIQIAANARLILRAMAAEMQGLDAASVSADVVAGGFNADGTIAEVCSNVTVKDETTAVEVTGCDLTSVTVVDAEAPVIADAAEVKAWDITPYIGTVKYTGSASVKLPIPEGWDTSLLTGFYVENGAAVLVKGTDADGYYSFTMPHFSVGGLMLLDTSTIENTVNVRIPVGGTSQTYTDSTGNYEGSATIEDASVAEMHIFGKAGAAETTVSTTKTTSADELTDGATFIIRYSNTSYALTSNKGGTTWGDSDGDSRAFERFSGAEADNMWTLEASGSGYKLKCAAGYLNLGKNAAWITASGGDTFTLSYSSGGWAIGDGTYNIDALGGLNSYYCAGGWPNSGTRFDLYRVTTSAPASTEVSFTGLRIGTTTAVVGTTQYNIEVLDPNNMFTKEENVELLVDEVKTYTDNTGNYEASYTGAGLDANIATVQVNGTTVEGGKTPVPVTSIVNDSQYYVRLTDGKYLTSTAGSTENVDDAALWSVSNYYNANQVYIKSGNNFLYYNNGSFTPTSNNWTIYSFNAGEISVNGVKLGTIVTLEDAAPVDVTDITITGVSKGETKVIVGETRYNITVIGTTDITIQYQTANGTTIKTETVTVADNATTYTVSNFNHNGKFYTVANTTLDITPATVTTYTVTVEENEEDLSAVTPLTLEYWQTNTQVVDGVGSTTSTRRVTALEAYSENGIEVITLVPKDTYTSNSNAATDPQVNYWRSRLLNRSTNEQSTENGDDETLSGTGFTKIRYWSGTWAVYTVDNEWRPVENLNEYQFVLYFMNDMNLADEVSVGTSDWGKKGDGTMANQYLGYDHVSIAFQVVYEDGTTSPATTSAAELDSFTYLVDNWGSRGVGTIALNQIGDYQIWKVTAETGTHTTSYNAGNPSDGTPAYVTNFVWDANELTVWEDAKNPVSHYTILNPSRAPSTEGANANLTWDEENESILIRIYIKAVKTEDSLTVVYYDEKFGDTLYTYNVSVKPGKNFTNDIGKVVTENGVEKIDTNQKPGEFTDDANRIDVTGYGIENILEKAQKFQTDLTQVPDAKGKYNSELYKYTGSKIFDDGKTLYLYYNIDTDVLSPNFVVDFGLPITFNLSDVVKTGIDTVESVSVKQNTRYGTLAYNESTNVFTYTPTTVLRGIDVLTITIKFAGETSAATTNVGVTPATSVYYEESFLLGTGATGWTTTSASLGTQETAVLGARQNEGSTINHYGYDDAYANARTSTGYITGGKGAFTSFTFTGTGFQLYGNSNSSSGYVTVMSNGGVNKMYMINTKLSAGTSDATNQQSGGTYCNLPFISETKLPFGTYTVQIKQTTANNDPSQDIYLDGVRILNTINDTTEGEGNIYYNDKEDNPDFYEVRDFVLHALGVAGLSDSEYIDEGSSDRAGLADSIIQLAGQVYNHLAAESASAVIVDKSESFTATDVQDLLDNGPKNELYLYNGQTLIFKFNTNRVAQLGLKAPTGTVSFTIEGTDSTLTGLATSVDMFYEIAGKRENAEEMTVTITNTGANVLSVTLLKICDDPNAAFLPLTQADIEDVLMDLYNVSDVEPPVNPSEPVKPETPTEPSKPVEPTEPEKPTEPEVEETKPTKPGKPEKPEKPEKPAKPGQNKPGKPAEKQKDAKLKITYVNLLGKKVGSATLTKTGTANQRCTFSASEIIGNAPARRNALWFLPVVSAYGSNVSIVVPVI